MPKSPKITRKQAPIAPAEHEADASPSADPPELDEIDFLNVFLPADELGDEHGDELEPLPEPGDFWLGCEDSLEPPFAA